MDPDAPIPSEVTRALRTLLSFFAGTSRERATPPSSERATYYTISSNPLGARTFRRAAAAGAFPTFRVGRKLFARKADVDAWIESHGRTIKRKPTQAENDRSFMEAHGLRVPSTTGR